MVTLRINSTGEQIEVIGEVVYVKQVGDIGDVTKANSNFTWTLKFPKTPSNSRAFKQLGISGSNSNTPYEKIVVQILDNGLMIEPNGNLIITETNENEYVGHVKAGIIDFLQDVATDSISDVIDLSALNHLNTVANIISSFTAGLPYKYIVAYYNGQLLADNLGVTNLNPFALVPSISVEYLWNAIFDHYGWTYSGNFDLSESWMTYPNAIGYSDSGNITVLDTDFPLQQVQYTGQPVTQTYNLLNPTINSIDADFVSNVNGYAFEILQTGNYRLSASLTGSAYWILGQTEPLQYQIFVSGQYQPVYLQSGEDYNIDITAPAGTIIYIIFKTTFHPFFYLEVESASLTIETLGIQPIDFSEALIKIKVKDFFKEVMVRHALTPFVDVENKAIRFRTLDERLTANAVDWSSKYVGRSSEKYVYESYAQNNLLKHKYNDPNVDYADGVLVVDNENQPAEKTLYQSFTYAPELELIEYHGTAFPTYYVQNFKMFDVEVQVDENDDLIANYKQLKDRFYFIRSVQREDDIYVLGVLAEEFSLATYSEVFADVVSDDYSNMGQLINNAKIVNIELALSRADVVNLNFYKRFYFEQERAVFLFNRLTWKEGNICTGEFVKINS